MIPAWQRSHFSYLCLEWRQAQSENAQKMKFPADLVTFAEKNFNGKPHFLSSVKLTNSPFFSADICPKEQIDFADLQVTTFKSLH